MKFFTYAVLSIIMLFTIQQVNAAHLSGSLQMATKMTGAQEVPAVSTSAVGVASFVLNEDRDEMCFTVSVNGLSGPITGIHVHEGAPGANGSVVTDLTSFVVGNRVAGNLSGVTLSPALIESYLSGDLYLNVHTAANPNGEIRGQITLETDFSYFALLNGAAEIPPVATGAQGVGVFNLARHKGKLDINIAVDGLSGPITGAHLHYGSSTTNGGVAQDLTSFVTGNRIVGSIDPADFLSSLEAGTIYVNVHTAANPDGEIRGQLTISPRVISFDSSLDGGQEVPAVSTTASGVAHIVVDNTLDQIRYEIQLTGFSSTITGAHFHDGAAGTNGGVLFDLSADLTDNRISGSITSGLTPEILTKFLSGGIYLNVHTDTNPNGEIRGQVYRLTRESFTFAMDGGQEVPSVSGPGKGGGIITIDRDRTNAHIMVVYNDLSGANGGMHLHNAAAGVNGGVIFDLTPFTTQTGPDDAAFVYWKATDTTPFTTAEEGMIRSGEVYVNAHTAANPGGEIRGQVDRGSTCYDITYIREEFANKLEARLYPVPLSGSDPLRLDINTSEMIANAQIHVSDVLGKTIAVQETDLTVGLNNLQIKHNTWNTGIYFVQIVAEGVVIYSSKIIK